MLTCTDISASYPGTPQGGRRGDAPILRSVTLSCAPRHITTILGPNGSGKTTLLRVLLGLLPLSQGSVSCCGRDISALSISERAARLAYAPQSPSAAAGFTTHEVLSLATAGLAARKADAHLDRVIADLELAPLLAMPHDQLSAGQRQRVSLARAVVQLLASPLPMEEKFLLADEPGSAMDPAHLLISESLLRSTAHQGLGVVIVLHDLLAAVRLADAVAVLSRSGTLTHAGSPDQILTPAILSQVFGTEFVATPHGPVLISARAGMKGSGYPFPG